MNIGTALSMGFLACSATSFGAAWAGVPDLAVQISAEGPGGQNYASSSQTPNAAVTADSATAFALNTGFPSIGTSVSQFGSAVATESYYFEVNGPQNTQAVIDLKGYVFADYIMNQQAGYGFSDAHATLFNTPITFSANSSPANADALVQIDLQYSVETNNLEIVELSSEVANSLDGVTGPSSGAALAVTLDPSFAALNPDDTFVLSAGVGNGDPLATPEPSSWSVVAGGLLVLFALTWRRARSGAAAEVMSHKSSPA